jgi:O-antigen ligase
VKRHAGWWLALAGLTFVPFAADAFDAPRQLVLVVGTAFLSFRTASVASRAMLAVVGLWLGAAVLTTLTSETPLLSLPALVTASAVGLFALQVRDAADLRPLLWVTWPIAAWAVAQAVGLDPFVWADAARWCGGVRPFSALGHPTQLGVFMALMAVLALDDARTRRASLATAAVAAMTCVLTLSRAGWLALAVGVVAWVALSTRGAGALQRRWLGVPALAAVLAVGVAGRAAIVERLQNFFVSPTRLHLWGTALTGFRRHPVLGWGFDTFMLVDQQFRHPDAWKYEWGGTAGHAHSLIPQTLATEGVLGMLALACCVLVVLRAWRSSPPPPGPTAAVLALAASSMVAFSGVLLAVLGAACLSVSLGAGAVPVRRSGWLALALLPPVTLTLIASACGWLGQTRGDPTWLARATTLEPWNGTWPAQRGAQLEAQGALKEALASYQLAVSREPGVAVFEANVGRVHSKLGEMAETRDAFDLARRHAPLDARIALDASEAALRTSDDAIVERTLSSTLALYPTDGPAWLVLAKFRLMRGRPVEARAALEASMRADWRDWPAGLEQARSLLVQVVARGGDPALANELAQRPAPTSLPADACGAPAFLQR